MKNRKKYNKLPVKVSRNDFNRYVKPFLSQGKRGPKPKISLFKIFNYILYVLHTGCQWERLPVLKKEVHWSAVYARHNRWSKDGSYEALFLNSIDMLNKNGKLDLSILHGDGSNTVAKKGAKELLIPDTNTKKVKKN